VRCDERCALASDSIEHGAKVVDSRLQVGKEMGTVGESRPPLVEDDQAREGAEALVEVPPVRRMPCPDEVRDPIRHEDDVEGASADHLVGDGYVAASGVFHLRHLHGRSLPHVRARGLVIPEWPGSATG
jgi:hypothetical protein